MHSRKECYICQRKSNLHYHHIYMGVANRTISDDNGFACYLCYEHHEGDFGVHGKYGHETDIFLKRECQRKYEKFGSRIDFMQMIGRSYL